MVQTLMTYLLEILKLIAPLYFRGVLRGSVVKCATRNPGVLGSSQSLGETVQSPSPVLVKPRKDMNNVSCRRDMTAV